MANRRKYEGEEEMQLKLLEVTEDPMFGKHVPQSNSALIVRGNITVDKPTDVPASDKAKLLH